jgi:glycosyltransferase involved in cell wall biosynthesis
MKIGFLIRYFKVGSGGAENYAYYLAKELAKNPKNEVHIFCSDAEEKEESLEGVKIHRAKETLKLSYYFCLYPSITEKIKKENLDILHVVGFGFIQNEITVKKLQKSNPNLKVICTPHGPFMALRNYSLFGWVIKRIYTPILINYLKDYDLFLEDNPCQNEWMKKEYKIPKEKIKFLPPGIPKEALTSSKKEIMSVIKKYGLNDKFVIAYLGRIQKYKGLDQIIKVLPELKKVKENILFVAMGRDVGDKERLEKLADSLSVKENVLFTGRVTDNEKFAILDLSEIFIFPSDWEAFGIVILEAMAHKNAILSSRTEGGLFLIEENKNGLLFDYGNEEDFYKKLTILVENNNLRQAMQKNNPSKTKRFLWPTIAKDLETIYTDVLKD